MTTRLQRILMIALLALTLALPAPLLAEELPVREPEAADMILDTVFCRPLGVVSTLLGTGIFLLASPFLVTAADEENASHAADKLVKDPFEFTFRRPLGTGECSFGR